MTTATNFFNKEEQQLIIDAIARAELHTSGEIRLHLDNFCLGDEVAKAKKVFTSLNMHQTRDRNGVLIYVATVSRKVAVIGDEGIHKQLGSEFWQQLVERLIAQFKADHKAEALATCIIECGVQLGKYFPLNADDKNELSNNISY